MCSLSYRGAPDCNASHRPKGPDALVGYVRVITTAQGRLGLGLEAQREALAHLAASEGFELLRVFIEVETGKGADASTNSLPQHWLKRAAAAVPSRLLPCVRTALQVMPYRSARLSNL
jgi:hypothetical protein